MFLPYILYKNSEGRKWSVPNVTTVKKKKNSQEEEAIKKDQEHFQISMQIYTHFKVMSSSGGQLQ